MDAAPVSSQPIFPPPCSTFSKATDVSTETPDKVLKKMRAEKPTAIEPPKPRRLYESPYYSPSPAKPAQFEGLEADATPAYPGHLGETGESPDEVCALKAMNMQLEAEKAGLEQEVANLRKQLSDMTLNQPDEGDTQNEQTLTSTTDEAVRKRLGRICARTSTGKHGFKN
jgi:hypothetical protein